MSKKLFTTAKKRLGPLGQNEMDFSKDGKKRNIPNSAVSVASCPNHPEPLKPPDMRLTTLGLTFQEVADAEKKRTTEKYLHTLDLKRMLEYSDPRKATFVIAHVSYFARLYEKVFIPCEIGLTAFNVEEGIIDNYWTLVDYEEPDLLGFTIDVHQNATELKIPVPPFDYRCRDYESIVGCIDGFMKKHLHPESRIQKVYCIAKYHGQLIASLRFLYNKCNRDVGIQVWSLEQVLRCLSMVGGLGDWKDKWGNNGQNDSADDDGELPLSVSYSDTSPVWNEQKYTIPESNEFNNDQMANDWLRSDLFAYNKGVVCPFHCNVKDGFRRCALSRTNRMAYNSLFSLTGRYGIQAVLSRHIPNMQNEDLEAFRRLQLLIPWGVEILSPKDLKKYPPPHRKGD